MKRRTILGVLASATFVFGACSGSGDGAQNEVQAAGAADGEGGGDPAVTTHSVRATTAPPTSTAPSTSTVSATTTTLQATTSTVTTSAPIVEPDVSEPDGAEPDATAPDDTEHLTDDELKAEIVAVLVDGGIPLELAECVADGIFEAAADRDQISRLRNAESPEDLDPADEEVLVEVMVDCI